MAHLGGEPTELRGVETTPNAGPPSTLEHSTAPLSLVTCCTHRTCGRYDDRRLDRRASDLRHRKHLRGIDVSEFQGNIDWSRVRASGVEFAFIRASYGRWRIDNTFDQNWARSRAAGVKRGAYQFYRPSQDPIEQADVLLETMGTLAAGDLPPVIDVEVGEGASSATIVNGVRRWLERVEAATGVRPIVYTSWGFWSGLSGAGFSAQRLLGAGRDHFWFHVLRCSDARCRFFAPPQSIRSCAEELETPPWSGIWRDQHNLPRPSGPASPSESFERLAW